MNPRKPNWDLKRDVQKKLSQLSRQTDAAIFQLIRNRVSENPEDATAANVIAKSTLSKEESLSRLEETDDSDEE